MGELVAAHVQRITHRYSIAFPEHPAREGDPHYVDFRHYLKLHRPTARCYVGEHIGFDWCMDAQGLLVPAPETGEQGGLELHHAFVEFSLQQGISLAALEKDFPGISNDTDVGAWVETDVNFRFLCLMPDTPVLMTDGSLVPIQDVQPGQRVIGKDGAPHSVTAVGRRLYHGPIVWLTPTLGLTEDHRVLTATGWLPAGEVAHQVGMFGANVVRLRGIEDEVLRPIVGTVAVDVMDAFYRRQFAPEYLLHDKSMLHDRASFVIDNAEIPSRGTLHGPMADVPLRQGIEVREAALVGAELTDVRSPIRPSRVVTTTDLADEDRRIEWLTTEKTVRTLYSGWVHDISVAHSHSFIAGGIVVHNCASHHRGPSGAHNASHSDWTASLYVENLIRPA